MITNETAKTTYTFISSVTEYAIGFLYKTNPDGSPQIKVYKNTLSTIPLVYGSNYTLSEDGTKVVISSGLESGDTLTIIRDIPMVQLSDYVIGRIDPEQIENDMDASVMRDQQILAQFDAAMGIPIDHENRIQACESDIDNLESLVPAQATEENKLVDEAFVNSSIATSTATFRGTYDTLAELEAVTADENDYGFVVSTDAAGNTLYSRYKYANGSWVFEYTLNNSSFTADQWASINSDVTSSDVAKARSAVQPSDLGNGTIAITQGGVTKGSFTLNQATNDTIALDASDMAIPDYSQGINVPLTEITQWAAPIDCFVSYQSGLKNGAAEALSIGGVRVCLIQQAASSFVYTTVGFYMKAGQILTGLAANDTNRDSTIYYFPLGA